MTNAAVTTEVHQALDIHRDISAQIAFNLKIRNRRSQLCYFRLREILNFNRRIDTRCGTDLFRTRITDAVNRRQRDNDVLIQRYVYACYTCHTISSIRALPLFRRPCRLTLALLVPRVSANHPYDAVATNDLAISADFLN